MCGRRVLHFFYFGVSTFLSCFFLLKTLLLSKDEVKVTVKTFVIYYNFK